MSSHFNKRRIININIIITITVIIANGLEYELKKSNSSPSWYLHTQKLFSLLWLDKYQTHIVQISKIKF